MTTKQRVLQANSSLSQSRIWPLQRAYFEKRGARAWQDAEVPYYITSNPFIAQSYAEMLHGWLRDVTANRAANVIDNQVFVLELGAGSGRLAFHLVRALSTLLSDMPIGALRVTYVLTDFAPATLEFWQRQPQLKQLAEAGTVDFAQLDLGEGAVNTLQLLHSGETVELETLANPVAVVANYVLDSLPHDIFRLEGGRLYEALATLVAPDGQLASDDPELLATLQISYEDRPTTAQYYPDARLNRILASYQQQWPDLDFALPVGALECIDRIRRWGQGRALLLSGDKGFHDESELRLRARPKVASHGSVSIAVNYHAVAAYTEALGGSFVATDISQQNLQVTLALFGDDSTTYAEARAAFKRLFSAGGPDDLFALRKGLKCAYKDLDLRQLVALLRMTHYDSNTLLDCLPVLLERLPDAKPTDSMALLEVVPRLWENHYQLGDRTDVAFALAKLCFIMARFEDARTFLNHSLRLHGPDANVYLNLALCCGALGDTAGARDAAKHAVVEDPTMEPAIALVQATTE